MRAAFPEDERIMKGFLLVLPALVIGYFVGRLTTDSEICPPLPLVPTRIVQKECAPCNNQTPSESIPSASAGRQIEETEGILWVPDTFPTPETGPLSKEPEPILDRYTEHIAYEDMHIHNYERMPSVQRKENYWLVVYVPTAVGFKEDQQNNFMVSQSVKDKGQPSSRRGIVRKNFRNSWLYKNGQAKLWFVLSSLSPLMTPGTESRKLIDAEQNQYGDLFFVACSDVDNDFNPPSGTTIKMGYAFQHAAVHYNYNYFARGSDDAHFNIDQLYRLLVLHNKVPKTRLFMGTRRFKNMGVRTAAQEKRFGSNYPTYPQGMGYVLSADVAVRVGRMVQTGVPFLTDWPEDAIVTSWITGWGLHIIDSVRWFHNKEGSGGPEFQCVSDSILTHDLSPRQLAMVDASGVWNCRGPK